MGRVNFQSPVFPERSELLFGADTIDLGSPSEFYQMVPVLAFRTAQILSANEPFVVFSRNPDVAELFEQNKKTPVQNNRLSEKNINGPSELAFSIFGNKEGRTQIVALDRSGTVSSKLTVSVKKLIPISCQYLFLTDKLTEAPANIAGLIRATAVRVRDLYLNQANIELVESGPIKELHVDVNLSHIDPVTKDKRIFLETVVSGRNVKTKIEFLNQQINQNGGAGNKVNVLATWRLATTPEKDKILPIRGLTTVDSNVSIAELTNVIDDNLNTFAHEIGHAIGLGGAHDARLGFLMSVKQGSGNRLTFEQIDHLNQTGMT